MIVSYKDIHESFKLNKSHSSLTQSTIKEIDDFLTLWQNNESFITVNTSGSTGQPKAIKMDKQAMVNSALATGSYFNLKPKNSALLCLPVAYIAGKMMLVRAMTLGLEIDCIEPKSTLEIDKTKPYDFVAMVPLQLQKNIKKLENIKRLIVGGAKVSQELINNIKHLTTKVYETYGMTETVSHIAIKPINTLTSQSTSYFNTLPDVTISLDNRDCLIIEVPSISKEKIVTNDIVKLHSKTEFEWLGRFDNVINSGGIKIHPEQIENQLATQIEARFFIASEKDNVLGEQVIIIIEGEQNRIDVSVFNKLKPFNTPKKVYYIKAFKETSSGKIQRKKTLDLL